MIKKLSVSPKAVEATPATTKKITKAVSAKPVATTTTTVEEVVVKKAAKAAPAEKLTLKQQQEANRLIINFDGDSKQLASALEQFSAALKAGITSFIIQSPTTAATEKATAMVATTAAPKKAAAPVVEVEEEDEDEDFAAVAANAKLANKFLADAKILIAKKGSMTPEAFSSLQERYKGIDTLSLSSALRKELLRSFDTLANMVVESKPAPKAAAPKAATPKKAATPQYDMVSFEVHNEALEVYLEVQLPEELWNVLCDDTFGGDEEATKTFILLNLPEAEYFDSSLPLSKVANPTAKLFNKSIEQMKEAYASHNNGDEPVIHTVSAKEATTYGIPAGAVKPYGWIDLISFDKKMAAAITVVESQF